MTGHYSLNTIKARFATLADDSHSCAFFKKWRLVKHLRKRTLIAHIVVAHEQRNPGCSLPSKLHRCTKLDLVRHLAFLVG